jgi:outer membrane protein assembly factor BamE
MKTLKLTPFKSGLNFKSKPLINRQIKSKMLGLSLALSASLLSGCSYLEPYKAPLTQGNVMTEESISHIQEGLTKGQVRELIGPPQGKNPFNPNHWEYVFYSSNSTLHTDSASHLIINFDEDEMIKDWKALPTTVALKQDDSWLGLDWF